MMIAPTNPRFHEHMRSLDLLRRFVVFSDEDPDVYTAVQESLTEIVAAMKDDGYTPEILRTVLRCITALAVNDAVRRNRDLARIRYFVELIHLELGQ